MNLQNAPASVPQTIDILKHLLPQQGMLKDFVHHNTLHAFSDQPFHIALATASSMLGYQTYLTDEEYQTALKSGVIRSEILTAAKKRISEITEQIEEKRMVRKTGGVRNAFLDYVHIDFETVVYPILFRLAGNYLDQGISLWKFPRHPDGFIASLRAMPWFLRNPEVRSWLIHEQLSIDFLLEQLLGENSFKYDYLLDQQLAHPGWSGMINYLDSNGSLLSDFKPISLEEFIKLELLLELDALKIRKSKGYTVPSDETLGAGFEMREIVLKEQAAWHEALEWSYYDCVLRGLRDVPQAVRMFRPAFQAVFCLDDREGSLRRHMESLSDSETFGTAGFFNLPIYYSPSGSNSMIKSCPLPIQPTHIIKEKGITRHKTSDSVFNAHAFGLVGGWFISQTIGLWSALRLIGTVFYPRQSPAMVSAAAHMPANSQLNWLADNTIGGGLKDGFTPAEAADALYDLFVGIGISEKFSDTVYLIGHGASSVNNTHYAAYDCGACSGRAGSVNARSAAALANHRDVRAMLNDKGLVIPETTKFIGGLHDTTRDELVFYDIQYLEPAQIQKHNSRLAMFDEVLTRNAAERGRKLPHVNFRLNNHKIHKQIKLRSQSLFEPRPEWNHAGNALCLVGPRAHFINLFLDRRAFFQSYEPYNDVEGKLLAGILRAITPVCGGINLEYFFSRTDTQKLGAGTKLSHNVMGLLGVANGMDGDLLPGLPAQMINIHEPLRLLMVVEQTPEVIQKALQSDVSTKLWYEKEWIFLVSKHPETGLLFRYIHEQFEPYEPVAKAVSEVSRNEVYFTEKNIQNPVMILK